MLRSFRILLTILVAGAVLSGCSKKQKPTPIDTEMGGASSWQGSGNSSTYDRNIVPDGGLPGGDGQNYGLGYGGEGSNIPGLESRNDPNGDAFEKTGYFNGKKMFEGELDSVFFAFDSSAISPSERFKLQTAADYLLENAGESLLIEGHADWYGTADYNLALGERRALSARDYLSTLGVSDARIETLSKGSLESTPGLPKDQSGTDRRVDLIILK